MYVRVVHEVQMATQAKSTTERRAPLSRDRVLDAAIRLADAGGIETLSMRRLGQELGVEAMSLYNHVANKEDILTAIVDMVVSEIQLPDPAAVWKAALRETSISAHEILLRHPWAPGLMLSGPSVRPARLQYMNSILGCLRKAGFSADMTHHAYHALDSHIMGFTLWEVGISAGMATLPRSVAGFLDDLPVDEYPHLAEHIEQHLKERGAEDEGEFEFGLDLVLDGLERTRDGARSVQH